MSDRVTSLSPTILRAAARDSLYAEFGEALNDHLTAAEIDEMTDERALRMLRQEVAERAAA